MQSITIFVAEENDPVPEGQEVQVVPSGGLSSVQVLQACQVALSIMIGRAISEEAQRRAETIVQARATGEETENTQDQKDEPVESDEPAKPLELVEAR